MKLYGLFFLALIFISSRLGAASGVTVIVASAEAQIDACANNSNELYCICESRGLRFSRTALRLQIKFDCALQCVLCRRLFSPRIRVALHKANKIINDHLFTSINRGDVETVYGLLVAGVTINAIDGEGMTALHLAAMNGHRKIVQLLLAMPDIDANIKDYLGDTASSLAKKYGYRVILEIIQAHIKAQQARQRLFDDASPPDDSRDTAIDPIEEEAPICLSTWDDYLGKWYGYGIDKAREYGLL